MVSKDMLALGKKSSVIREIFEYSNKRRAEIGADKVFDFSLGNPSIPAPTVVNAEIARLVAECDPVDLHGYTSAPGDMAVRCTIAENIRQRHGIETNPCLIYMTCGAAASLTVTLKALTTPGDEVVLLAPYFPEYQVFVANAGAVPVVAMCKPDTFDLDVAALEAAITPKTRAVIVNSPNNPSGVVLGEDSIKVLATLLERKVAEYGHSITILADEPYRELVYGDVQVPYIPCYYKDTIVCYSYSKSLSLPGERIGYIAVFPQAPDAEDTFAAICGAGRSMGYVCAPSMLQRVVAACDGTSPDISAYDRNRRLLCQALSEIGYEFAQPDGAFYLFMKALEPDANAFYERAKQHELLLVPSDSFGVPGYVRIAYCVSYQQIERSLPAFRKLYEEYNTK